MHSANKTHIRPTTDTYKVTGFTTIVAGQVSITWIDFDGNHNPFKMLALWFLLLVHWRLGHLVPLSTIALTRDRIMSLPFRQGQGALILLEYNTSSSLLLGTASQWCHLWFIRLPNSSPPSVIGIELNTSL
jgi:hypothetical protein